MTQTENQEVLRNFFPFPGIRNLSSSMEADAHFRAVKKDNESETAMRLPVNNYLKTPEEIEREFRYAMNSHKTASKEKNGSWEKSGVSIIESGRPVNIHNLEVTLPEFMEENY